MIIDGTHIDPEQFLTRTFDDEFNIRITPVTELDNKAVRDMQVKMSKIDQNSATLIIPFLLTVDISDHA